MADDQGVISGQLEVAGTYTLTPTTANAPSHAPAGDRNTAFTGALLRTLDDADPLTLDQIYVTIDRDLAARNLPRPQRRAVNTAGNLALSRGPATRSRVTEPHTDRPDSGVARFTHTYSLALSWPRVRRTVFVSILVLCLAYLNALADGLGYFQLIIGVLTLVVMLVALLSILKRGKARVREVVVDRSGLTVQRKDTKIHLPWRDIAQVGVLQPERGAINRRLPAAQYTRKQVLVVHLRPDIIAPSVVSVLSDEHRQLGYLGLCTVEDLGSSREEMASALERFAGGKLVHSSRQFLDRDPRLRPEMV